MNIGEFKSWIDGFSEAIDGAPTQDQWSKIKKKIDCLVDRYPLPNVPVCRGFDQEDLHKLKITTTGSKI